MYLHVSVSAVWRRVMYRQSCGSVALTSIHVLRWRGSFRSHRWRANQSSVVTVAAGAPAQLEHGGPAAHLPAATLAAVAQRRGRPAPALPSLRGPAGRRGRSTAMAASGRSARSRRGVQPAGPHGVDAAQVPGRPDDRTVRAQQRRGELAAPHPTQQLVRHAASPDQQWHEMQP